MEFYSQGFWNISEQTTLFVLSIISLFIFFIGFYNRFIIWHSGHKDPRLNYNRPNFKVLINFFINHSIVKIRGNNSRKMHFIIYLGFWGLFLTSFIAALQVNLNIIVNRSMIYLVISFLFDLFGFFALVGIIMAAYRRFIKKRNIMANSFADGLILGLIFSLLLTGFIIEGLRMYVVPGEMTPWAPIGLGLAYLFKLIGISLELSLVLHKVIWYGHMLLALGFIAYIPYSKLIHIIIAPFNQYLGTLYPKGTLTLFPENQPISRFNGNSTEIFTWKQLLENDTCIGCFRCQKHCPVFLTSQKLAPKELIQSLKRQQVAVDGIWECITCLQCEERCPLSVEHLSKIIDLRRYSYTKNKFVPPEVTLVSNNLKSYGNPWGKKYCDTEKRMQLSVTPLHERKKADVLYWIGCTGIFDEAGQRITKAVIEILQKANIDFTILGSQEKCCGHMVRRLGNEVLFQELVQENIKAIENYNAATIITHCPHCFHTLKNEYPPFSNSCEIVHHSQFIKKLLENGQININKTIEVKNIRQTDDTEEINSKGYGITYHDPCYLGRYNDIYDDPREILALIPRVELIKMEHSGASSLCCGGGSGHSWFQNSHTPAINVLRTEEAINTKAEIITTSCPFCLNMISQGVVELGINQRIKTLDLAELINNLI